MSFRPIGPYGINVHGLNSAHLYGAHQNSFLNQYYMPASPYLQSTMPYEASGGMSMGYPMGYPAQTAMGYPAQTAMGYPYRMAIGYPAYSAYVGARVNQAQNQALQQVYRAASQVRQSNSNADTLAHYQHLLNQIYQANHQGSIRTKSVQKYAQGLGVKPNYTVQAATSIGLKTKEDYQGISNIPLNDFSKYSNLYQTLLRDVYDVLKKGKNPGLAWTFEGFLKQNYGLTTLTSLIGEVSRLHPEKQKIYKTQYHALQSADIQKIENYLHGKNANHTINALAQMRRIAGSTIVGPSVKLMKGFDGDIIMTGKRADGTEYNLYLKPSDMLDMNEQVITGQGIRYQGKLYTMNKNILKSGREEHTILNEARDLAYPMFALLQSETRNIPSAGKNVSGDLAVMAEKLVAFFDKQSVVRPKRVMLADDIKNRRN